MRIDRSRFLAFTATLAAGCAANHGRNVQEIMVVDIPPAPLVDAGTSVDATTLAARVPPTGEGIGPPPTLGESYPPDEDAVYGILGALAGFSCSLPSKVFDPASKACANATGKPLDCKLPVQSGSPDGEFAVEKCMSYALTMRPGVARLAQGCLKKLAKNPDACEVYRCGNNALMQSCANPKAAAACQRFKMTDARCVGYLSGLNDAGLTSVETCAKKASATPTFHELYSCVESL